MYAKSKWYKEIKVQCGDSKKHHSKQWSLDPNGAMMGFHNYGES